MARAKKSSTPANEQVTIVGRVGTTALRRDEVRTVTRTEHVEWLIAEGYVAEVKAPLVAGQPVVPVQAEDDVAEAAAAERRIAAAAERRIAAAAEGQAAETP